MTDPSLTQAAECVAFWREAGFERWFKKDAGFDADFVARFTDLHFSAARGGLDHWIEAPEPSLALMILLDQFPRNAFRDTGHMFATDPLARHWAGIAIERGHDRAIEPALAAFFYMPYMHSEALADQDRALALFEPLGETWLHHAVVHRDIIVRFGRFPHRNKALGRISTEPEIAFLDEGGFSG